MQTIDEKRNGNFRARTILEWKESKENTRCTGDTRFRRRRRRPICVIAVTTEMSIERVEVTKQVKIRIITVPVVLTGFVVIVPGTVSIETIGTNTGMQIGHTFAVV